MISKDEDKQINFGKYKGEKLSMIAIEHPFYLYRLLCQIKEEFGSTLFYQRAHRALLLCDQPMPFGKAQGKSIKKLAKYCPKYIREFKKKHTEQLKNEEDWLLYKLRYVTGDIELPEYKAYQDDIELDVDLEEIPDSDSDDE
jgi:uncharacterized protein (DUF3820 family)